MEYSPHQLPQNYYVTELKDKKFDLGFGKNVMVGDIGRMTTRIRKRLRLNAQRKEKSNTSSEV